MIKPLNIKNPMLENEPELERKINEIIEVVNDLTDAFPKYKDQAEVRRNFEKHRET